MSGQLDAGVVRSYRRSILAGLAAGVLGFLAVPILGSGAETALRKKLYTVFPTASLGDQTVNAVLFGNANGVPLSLGPIDLNPVLDGGVAVVVVPALLLVAGSVAASRAEAVRSAAVRGAAVATGYVPVSVLTVYAFGATQRGYTLSVDPVQLAVHAAVLGVVLGGLGGVLGLAVRTDDFQQVRDAAGALPLRTGAVAGAAAFVAAFAVTYAVGTSGIGKRVVPALVSSVPWAPDDFTAAGYFFYNSQFVPLDPFSSGPVDGNFLHNFTMSGEYARLEYLHLLAPVALLVAGFGAARRTGRGALAGASTAVGYGALAVAGVFVFATTSPAGSTVQPNLALAVVRPGLAYPLVFGTLGGAIAARVGS